MTRLAVFQHVWWKGPGKFLLEAAADNGTVLDVIEIWHQAIPNLLSYDGLILLGGTPYVDEEENYSFLQEEKQAIHRWLQGDKPCLGICHGQRLLAEEFGGEIGRNFCDSVGFIEGHLTSSGRTHPIFNGIDTHLPLFKWHNQVVLSPVPRHFQVLATSKECQVEAFTIANRPYLIGVQFDNHAAAPEDVSQWIKKDAIWLHSITRKDINTKQIAADAEKLKSITKDHFRKFFSNFIKLAKKDSERFAKIMNS